MEPFEWLLLGAGLAVGSLVGSRGKEMMRTAAKGYLYLAENTRTVTANMREDFRDALEEARYERDEEDRERDMEDRAEARSSGNSHRGAMTEGRKTTSRNGQTGDHTSRARSPRASNSRTGSRTTGSRGRKKAEQEAPAEPAA